MAAPLIGRRPRPASVFDHWHPITSDLGLIEAPLEAVCDAYADWHKEVNHGVGITKKRQRCNGRLDKKFAKLVPLSNATNHTLFSQTASDWTAYFANGIQGSDPGPPMHVLAERMNARAMRICVTPPAAVYPAVMWEVYDPAAPRTEHRLGGRGVAVSNDGGRWVFHASGEPYDFEQTERYTARIKRQRFDLPLLLHYLQHFGIPCWGDALFDPPDRKKGVMFTKPYFDHIPQFSLDEVRAGVPWQR